MIRTRPSLVVEGSLSQNKVVVVEVKLRSVIEEHFADLAVERVLVDIYFDVQLLKSLRCCVPKFEKAILAREAIRLQQNFIFTIVNYVAGKMLCFGMLAYVLVHRGTILQRNSQKRRRRIVVGSAD